MEGCPKDRSNGALCAMHNMRKHRTGSLERLPIFPIRITDLAPVGLNITALRYRHAMSADVLAKRAETTTWTIWNVCRGESCHLDLLWRIGAVFNVEAWRLLRSDEFILPDKFKERCR